MGIESKFDPRAPRPKPLAIPPGVSTGPIIGVGSSAGPQAPPNPWVQHGNYVSYRRGTVVGVPLGNAGGPNMGDGTLNAQMLYIDGVPILDMLAGLQMLGVFNPSNSTIIWNNNSGYSGNALPPPEDKLHGNYLIATVGGSNPPAGAPVEDYHAGDWLLCSGTAWYHIHIDPTVVAADVAVVPPVGGQTTCKRRWKPSTVG